MSIAFELAVRRGAGVTVYDTRTPGRGASWAAAGMIAPAFEAAAGHGIHPLLFDLCLESAGLWPGFAADLERASGLPAGYDPAPALAVAGDEAEAAHLAAIARVLASRGVAHEVLDSAGLRRREPALFAGASYGLELSTDTRIDNRSAVMALAAALKASPRVTFRNGPAPLKSGGRTVTLEGHDAVIAAAGWQTAVIKVEEGTGLYSLVNWDAALDDIDCYGGQMLSVAAGAGAPERVVRSGDVYLVPRGGQIVIGATVEPFTVPDGADEAATETLRRAAIALCPGLEGAKVTERWSGVRPGTPDHAPFLGETAAPGLFVAAGHYRNGILLAPVTAQIMADLVMGREAGQLAAAFSPRRGL
ncbi:MAG: FAD-dependent oxidoreductase, partial [Hyphomonas sp.]